MNIPIFQPKPLLCLDCQQNYWPTSSYSPMPKYQEKYQHQCDVYKRDGVGGRSDLRAFWLGWLLDG